MAKRKTAREKLHIAREPHVEVLGLTPECPESGKTLLIPTPLLVDAEIRKIPAGTTITFSELRDRLASAFGADQACPLCSGIFWRLSAEAAEEDRAEGREDITPYWRVTKDGKPNPKLPGGVEGHRSLLAAEGVVI